MHESDVFLATHHLKTLQGKQSKTGFTSAILTVPPAPETSGNDIPHTPSQASAMPLQEIQNTQGAGNIYIFWSIQSNINRGLLTSQGPLYFST